MTKPPIPTENWKAEKQKNGNDMTSKKNPAFLSIVISFAWSILDNFENAQKMKIKHFPI